MTIVRRENITKIADKNRELEALEAQYKTLSDYNDHFGFVVDYDQRYKPPGARKAHFDLEITRDDEAYAGLKSVLKQRVRSSIENVCEELNRLGVKIDTNVLIGFLDANPRPPAEEPAKPIAADITNGGQEVPESGAGQ